MNIISASKLKKEFSGEVLFEHVSFDIQSGEKIAIIGKNGSGKTTLIQLLLKQMDLDNGEIHINKKASIGYLSQDVIKDQSSSLFEEMLHVFDDVIQLENKLHNITKKLETHPHNQEYLAQYARLESIFLEKGGYDFHYRIDYILNQFGFEKEDYDRLIHTFSGGEKTRISFAKLLLQNPNLLILDEPTNHLDIHIIEWLEDYLNKYEGAVVIVTHDKYFINKVCNRMIELDQHTSYLYYGSYEEYIEEKAKRYELLMKQYERQQKEISHLQSFVDRFRYNAKRASIAQDRVKKIERMDKVKRPTKNTRTISMSLEGKRPTTDIILEAKDLTIGYDRALVTNLNFQMRGFDKLAILGPNGTGKTTLLHVLQRKLKPITGSIHFLRDYNIGYFDQNQSTLHEHKTVFEEIHDLHPMFTNYDVRRNAARFLFYGEDVDKRVSVLSGGERVRLVLLLLMLEKPDLLILDEPTNHLDIDTKDVVESVLQEFNGPIIVVSHDRYFINTISTKIVYLEEDNYFVIDGDYDDLKARLDKRKERQKQATKQQQKPLNYKTKNILQKEIRDIETEIEHIETTIKTVKNETFLEEVYSNHETLAEKQDQIHQLETSLHAAEQKYLSLMEQLEERRGE